MYRCMYVIYLELCSETLLLMKGIEEVNFLLYSAKAWILLSVRDSCLSKLKEKIKEKKRTEKEEHI